MSVNANVTVPAWSALMRATVLDSRRIRTYPSTPCGVSSATRRTLPARGSAWRAGSRSPEAPQEERRIVSIIFVDLVGSTAQAETLDPEDVRAILTPYHDLVRREIESFGGVVEKFIGDAIMGVFGAPFAHGDDAERAVRAAFVVRDSVCAMPGGKTLQIRDRGQHRRGGRLAQRAGGARRVDGRRRRRQHRRRGCSRRRR